MDKTLTEQLEELYARIDALENKVADSSVNVEEKDPTPYSIGNINKIPMHIADIGVGSDGHIIWNDSELRNPPFGKKPENPKKGYNRHFHTRYAGGALDVQNLEIVEYNVNWGTDPDISAHNQQFWGYEPKLKTAQNSKNENVDKIGNVVFVFDADSKKWGASAFEIDIAKCFFVRKNPNGTIMTDENDEPMRSPIFNEDKSLTSIIWDADNQCWRFYAVYAELPPSP